MTFHILLLPSYSQNSALPEFLAETLPKTLMLIIFILHIQRVSNYYALATFCHSYQLLESAVALSI